MSKLSPVQREELLQALREMGGSGQAESENPELFCQRFYPVVEHLRAFSPEVTLIVGERGSGKSELFGAAMRFELLSVAAKYASGVRLPPLEAARTKWLAAYPIGSKFPDPQGQHRFLNSNQRTSRDAQQLWFAYLVRLLQPELDAEASETLPALFAPQGGDAEAVVNAFNQAGQSPLLALDRLDERLFKEDRRIFVGYDELDTLGDYDWQTMGTAISGLISFWASYARRWRRLRAKIFMRTDLFRRNTSSLSADLPKLAANRVEVSWSDRNLYGMLIKRIANSSLALQEYCASSRVGFKGHDTVLGWIPDIATAEDAKPLVQRMIGPYMGANQNKGLTFNWLLDHIRDGQDKAYPRALVRLIEQAAVNEMASPKVGYSRLIDPTSIRRAIDNVSELQVTQAISNEWPWLEGVRSRIRRESVPMTRRQLEYLLSKDWSVSWNSQRKVRPPADDQRVFVNYLVELGIMRQRGDGRLDTPDLYQSGLGLERKGGVRRNR
jgi:hypothetical protein